MFQKLWFQHVWPCLQQEMKTQEVLAAVLQPTIFLVQECSIEEYEAIILPSFRIPGLDLNPNFSATSESDQIRLSL
uniref:Uncharacterized protein n=1 Tax=Timema cristinae TaxID=61476 RepID=A0A7R9D7M5_TIMCR|nr:unnamed protein product [Timema cristinae]